jgi:DNA mismatch repair ATPase MutS
LSASLPYIIFALVAIVIIVIIVYNGVRIKKRELLQQLRDEWGEPKEEHRDFDKIGKFAEVSNEKTFHRLSTQTINDVDFHELFSFIDRTTSRVGQQYLYKQVTQPTNSIKELQNLDEKVNLFSKDIQLREKIQLELVKLSGRDSYYISNLLGEQPTKRPMWYRFIPLSTLLVISLLALSPWYPVLFIVLLAPITLNVLLHYWNKSNLYQYVKSFPQLSLLINVSKSISNNNLIFKDSKVDTAILSLRPFQQKLRLLNLGDGSTGSELSNFGLYFVELLKAILLVELYTTTHLIKELTNKKDSILNLFNYVGKIDATVSVASLRAGSLPICKPVFIPGAKRLTAIKVVHPLVVGCVPNDLTIDSKSILITGSNMSGKTTFLRTLAINSILAQTIYTCFAESFTTPFVKQFSSIRIDDNLLDGKSFYFQEVSVVASLLDEVAPDQLNLFVLDEVFKGTNTIERIAASKAILSFLNQGQNMVIVSTHDIELAEMLKAEYDLYHFAEAVEGKQLSFDHTLKEGPLKTRNAITILEIAGYPKKIIEEAKKLSDQLGKG